MRITHLGHASVLFEAADVRILFDPGTFSDLWHGTKGLDGVLVTHQHPDHVDPEHVPGLLENNPRATVHTADDVHQTVKLARAHTVAPGDRFQIGAVEIEAVGGYHAVVHEDIPLVHNVGYVLRAENEPVFFHPGDSLDALPEGIDLLALPLMGPWAALKEHVEFIRALDVPDVSIPIHDELLSDRGRKLLSTQITNLTGTEIASLRGGDSREF